MKIRFLFSLLLLTFTQLFSQHSISGKTVDNEGAALPFATVIVQSIDDKQIVSSGSTGVDGTFELSEIPAGLYNITFDFIGFNKITVDSVNVSGTVNLEPVTLGATEQKIEEVVIKADKAKPTLGIKSKKFKVDENANAAGGTAVDVLNNLPSVDVDQDGNVSLRGSSELRILIDGKPTGLRGEDIGAVLAQISADDIENIEIITVPGAKYDAESAGGIINIELKRSKKEGKSASLNFNYGHFDKLNAGGRMSYKKNRLSINLNYGFRHGTFTFDRLSSTKNSELDSLIEFIIVGNGDNNTPSHLGKISLDYQLSDKSKIGINSNISSGNRITNRDSYYDWDNQDVNGITHPDVSIERNSFSTMKKTNLVNGLYFSHKFKNKASIKLSSTHSFQGHDGEGSFEQEGLVQSDINILNGHEFTENLDISIPYEKGKTEFGSQFTYRTLDNKYSFTSEDPLLTSFSNDFVYQDEVTALYFSQSFAIGKSEFDLGLRSEYTHSNSSNSSTNLDRIRGYWMHFPSANIRLPLNDVNDLGFNYSRRITRPNARQLNPSPSLADPFSLHIGNPDVIPASNDIMELLWLNKNKKFTVQTTAFYQLRLDRVRRIRFVDENAVSTVQWVNYDREDYYGLEIFTRIKWASWFTTNFSANAYERLTDGSNISDTYVTRYFGWDGKFGCSLKLPRDWKVLYNAEYKSRKQIVIGTIQPRYFMDLAVQKKIMENKGKITVRLSDVFNTRQFEIETLVENFEQSGVYKRETRILFLGFSYNFRGIKEKKEKIKNIREIY